MKTPLFEVKITAYGDPDTGAVGHCVLITGRYKQHDGKDIGHLHDCTLDEAIEYAKGAVTTFLEGTEA